MYDVSWKNFQDFTKKADTRQRSCWDKNWRRVTLDVVRSIPTRRLRFANNIFWTPTSWNAIRLRRISKSEIEGNFRGKNRDGSWSKGRSFRIESLARVRDPEDEASLSPSVDPSSKGTVRASCFPRPRRTRVSIRCRRWETDDYIDRVLGL